MIMTPEELRELEVKIASDILNNIQFSLVYQLISLEAHTRAKKFVSEATEEELAEVKKKMDEAEAASIKAEAEAAAEAKTEDKTAP